MDLREEIAAKAKRAKDASYDLAALSAKQKNQALLAMADALVKRQDLILEENQKDMSAGRSKGLSHSLLDRLMLNEARIEGMAEGLKQTASLPDPVGEGLGSARPQNGLEIQKVRVPLGVVGIVYEARPNVTADAIGLCVKSGNAVVLRGGSEALYSNAAIVSVMTKAAYAAGVPEGAVQFIDSVDREAVQVLIRQNAYLDVIIPRGGAGLIRTVVEHSSVPVIETGTGVCHVFVDASADFDMAERIVLNAKTTRPAVCNSIETLLVHEAAAAAFLPRMARALAESHVEVRGCEATRALCPEVSPATEDDWGAEYGELILSVKVVRDLDTAIAHITRYGTKHSEAIVTNDYQNARRFHARVDAAAVYVNASTRFTDGFEFGFGAEIGISTQKLHARGPMGLAELTSVKYLIFGEGQIR